MAKRIFQAICLVAALVLVLSTVVLTAVLYDQFAGQIRRELQVEAAYIAHGLELEGASYLDTLGDKTRRITLIDAGGAVRYDNAADAAAMENHLDREEVQQALSFLAGLDIRGIAQKVMEELFRKLAMRYEFSPDGLLPPEK